MRGDGSYHKIFALALYIAVADGYVKSSRHQPAVFSQLFIHSGRRPSYMIPNSPYTCAQFRIGIVHFFVASKVARYRAFSRAVPLGNTLLWRLSFRYVAFSDSIALVVYMTFLTAPENLKIGETASQLSFQRFIEFGYFGVPFLSHAPGLPALFSHRPLGRSFLNPTQRLSCLCPERISGCSSPGGRYSAGIRSLEMLRLWPPLFR